MSHLIEKDGERQYVNSLDGYEDWTVVPDVPAPQDGCELVNNEWVPNPELQLELQQQSLQNMTREELIAWIEIMEARIDTLEDQING
jgi:hypothetical protein